jgi:hypothetical protein
MKAIIGSIRLAQLLNISPPAFKPYKDQIPWDFEDDSGRRYVLKVNVLEVKKIVDKLRAAVKTERYRKIGKANTERWQDWDGISKPHWKKLGRRPKKVGV